MLAPPPPAQLCGDAFSVRLCGRVHPELLACLAQLLGPDIDAFQVATVVKSPQLSWCGGGYGCEWVPRY